MSNRNLENRVAKLEQAKGIEAGNVFVVDWGRGPKAMRAEIEERARRHRIAPEAVTIISAPWIAGRDLGA